MGQLKDWKTNENPSVLNPQGKSLKWNSLEALATIEKMRMRCNG